MSAHTPGPWQIEEVRDSREKSTSLVYARISTGDQRIGAAVVYAHPTRGKRIRFNIREPEALANARLIAAAPDMLHALKVAEWGAVQGGDPYCPECHQWRKDGHADDCSIQRAIAKAEGSR